MISEPIVVVTECGNLWNIWQQYNSRWLQMYKPEEELRFGGNIQVWRSSAVYTLLGEHQYEMWLRCRLIIASEKKMWHVLDYIWGQQSRKGAMQEIFKFKQNTFYSVGITKAIGHWTMYNENIGHCLDKWRMFALL
jgi:hypothetical protein